ncbi:MAG: hypothetical protein HY928_17780 [Elusimicrobia bacterium]|nr:hypothetical protein [Elusimicrobiota bacterium]
MAACAAGFAGRGEGDAALFKVLAASMAALTLLLWVLLGGPFRPAGALAPNDFDLTEVPSSAPAPGEAAPRYLSRAEREADARLALAGPSLGEAAAPTPVSLAPGAPGVSGNGEARAQEPNYDRRQAAAELDRLSALFDRVAAKEPVARALAKEFAGMKSLAPLRERYAKDGDAAAFLRGAARSAEVRRTVKRYAADADAWRAAVTFLLQAVPGAPKPLYAELKRFLLADRDAAGFVAEVSASIVPRAGWLLMGAVRPGQDLSALKGLGDELMGLVGMPGPPPIAN